jgi:hypothetical protein
MMGIAAMRADAASSELVQRASSTASITVLRKRGAEACPWKHATMTSDNIHRLKRAEQL